MCAEFVGPLGMQTIESLLRIVLCVYNVQENREARRETRSVIRFLNARNMKPVDIRQLCEVYGEHAMSDSVVWRWVRNFNEGHENVHDDPQSSRPSVVNEHLVQAVEEKIQEN
jgi:transposase